MGQPVYVLTNDLLRENPDLGALRVTFLETSEGEVIFDPPLPSLAICGSAGKKESFACTESEAVNDP